MSNIKKLIRILLAVVLCAALCGCSVKMTTVRPSEINGVTVERISDGQTVTFPSETLDGDTKDRLILSLERFYDKVGSCTDSDSHAYKVSLFIGDKTDTELFINADGSVCRRGSRYIPTEDSVGAVDIADWDALFKFPSEDAPAQECTPYISGDMQVCYALGASLAAPVGEYSCTTIAEIGAYSYYLGMVTDESGESSAVLWRDTPKGDADYICVIPDADSDTGVRHNIFYAGGDKESGGKYLYFSLIDSASLHDSLWVLDTERLFFTLMYDTPCSNFIIPENPPADYQNLGWLVHEYYLIPVQLDQAKEYTGGIIDLQDFYAANGEELFFGIGDFGTHKWVSLSQSGASALTIDSIVAEPATSAPEQTVSHTIDFATGAFE